MDIRALQENVSNWAKYNFGDRTWVDCFMGLVEEVGELSHALLKQQQGIRGSAEDHEAAAKDAVGDIILYLADLCHRRGWDMDRIICDTLSEVLSRDWQRYPDSGEPPEG